MLFHHDSRAYDAAATHAAEWARDKFHDMTKSGMDKGVWLLQKVEAEEPEDRIVRARAMSFEPTETAIKMHVKDNDGWSTLSPLHKHALGQAVDRTELFNRKALSAYLDAGAWGREQVSAILTDAYQHIDSKRYLVRSTPDHVKGILSDRFRRMDSRPIVDAFVKEAMTSDKHLPMAVTDAHWLETSWNLRLMLCTTFEPVPNEVMAYGIQISNSDYGDGALSLRAFCLRLWCTNLAITEEAIRKVHVGRRLSDDIAYSQRTYELDTAATASAVGDTVRLLLSPAYVDEEMAKIKKAAESNVDPKTVLARLRARNDVLVGEAKEIAEAFNQPDIEMLPAGNNKWRLSNAISLIAGRKMEEDERRGCELQAIAGKVLR
uniref:DUF932 domain-containing protein n=1 Tax=viral metagenome TaxID=1070528 RepID=A0A6M3KSL1_9ZZZZ